jgi:hypothetical protein
LGYLFSIGFLQSRGSRGTYGSPYDPLPLGSTRLLNAPSSKSPKKYQNVLEKIKRAHPQKVQKE